MPKYIEYTMHVCPDPYALAMITLKSLLRNEAQQQSQAKIRLLVLPGARAQAAGAFV